MTDEKVRENRLRRMAERQGFKLIKSRRRDSRAIDYGKYFLSETTTSALQTSEHGLDIDEVEAYLGGGPEIVIPPSGKLDFSFDDSGGKPILEFTGHGKGGPAWTLHYLNSEGNVDDFRVGAKEDEPDWAEQQARQHLLRIGYSPKASD